MMTLTVPVSSRWTLLLSAYLTLTVSADCGEECAYCLQKLPLQLKDLNSIECVLECEEHLNAGSSWSLCKHFMQNADNAPKGNQESTEVDSPQHRVDKKYGGFMKRSESFMKRYGGFMKKAAELYGLEPEDVDQGRAILNNHDVEMLAHQVEADGEREEAALTHAVDSKGGTQGVKGMEKRYGGFMRRGVLSDLESGVRELQKRYGGFMRRVGRPDWWQDSKRYGGFLKRSQKQDEDEYSSEIEKRYGGFMGY